jgi:hypothetical protein
MKSVPLPERGKEKDSLFSELRVVSVRVDPCFPGSAPPSCIKQVCLGWSEGDRRIFG